MKCFCSTKNELVRTDLLTGIKHLSVYPIQLMFPIVIDSISMIMNPMADFKLKCGISWRKKKGKEYRVVHLYY